MFLRPECHDAYNLGFPQLEPKLRFKSRGEKESQVFPAVDREMMRWVEIGMEIILLTNQSFVDGKEMDTIWCVELRCLMDVNCESKSNTK